MNNDPNVNTDAVQPDASQAQPTSQTPAQPQGATNTPTTQPTQSEPSAAQPTNMVSNPPAQPANAKPQPAQPSTDPNAGHPLVQHASVLHSIAEVLSGGPHYKPVIDPTGKTTLEKIPMSGKNLGFAIALSAITGALSGLQEKGPNANAKAAGAGFNAVTQQREKADEDARQQATQDFARQMALTNTNFQLHQNAMNLGHQDYEQHQQYVKDHKPVYDVLTKVPGAIQADDVRESDLGKYHVTRDTAIPTGVVPRLNPDGSQAQDRFGAPMWDNTYAIVDPHAKIALPEDTAKLLADFGVQGYQNSKGEPISIGDYQLKAHTVLDGVAKASAIKIADANLNRQSKQVLGDKATPIDLKAAIKADPSLVNALEDYQKYAGFPIDQALDLMSKSKDVDATSVGQIANLVGPDAIRASRLRREADDEKTKTQARVNAENAGKAAQEAPEIESIAQSLAKGDLTSLKDVTSMRGDQRSKVYTRAKQLNPNFNTKDVELKAGVQKAFATGKQGDQIQSFNTFLGHAGEAAQASAAYRRIGSPLLNKPLNWLEKNATDDRTYQTFITALQPVRDEYMTFLQNNHALTESDKKASDKIMSDESTPAQIEDALKQMSKTAFIRLDSLNDRYKRVMGADFPDFLNDDAKNAASILGLGSQAAKYQSGGRVTGSAGGVVPGKREPAQPGQPQIPTGATMKVPGSDGKLHWSDGKKDLGVVQ